jgi:Tat protein secretion system quality control protein TatD with DNase activity
VARTPEARRALLCRPRLCESITVVPLFDAHFHLDSLASRGRSLQDNFSLGVASYCFPRHWLTVGELGHVDQRVTFAFGVHPRIAHQVNRADLPSRLNTRITSIGCRVVAVGEVGLDYLDNPGENIKKAQSEVLAISSKIALDRSLPMVIHCRGNDETATEASADCLKILRSLLPRCHPIYRHCFTGALGEAEEWLSTFPNTVFGFTCVKSLKGERRTHWTAAMRSLPLSALVVETDSPYILDNPGDVSRAVSSLATLRGVSRGEIGRATFLNAKHFYAL